MKFFRLADDTKEDEIKKEQKTEQQENKTGNSFLESLKYNPQKNSKKHLLQSIPIGDATIINVPDNIVNKNGSVFDGSDTWYEIAEFEVTDTEWDTIKRFAGNSKEYLKFHVNQINQRTHKGLTLDYVLKDVKKGGNNISIDTYYWANDEGREEKDKLIFQDTICHDGMIVRNYSEITDSTDRVVAQMQTKKGRYYYKIFSNRLIQNIEICEPYDFFRSAIPSITSKIVLGLNGFKHLLCYNNTFKNLRINSLVYMFIDRSQEKKYPPCDDPEILPGVFRIKRPDDHKDRILIGHSYKNWADLSYEDELPYMDFYEKLLLTRERKLGDIPFINSPKEPNNGDGR